MPKNFRLKIELFDKMNNPLYINSLQVIILE